MLPHISQVFVYKPRIFFAVLEKNFKLPVLERCVIIFILLKKQRIKKSKKLEVRQHCHSLLLKTTNYTSKMANNISARLEWIYTTTENSTFQYFYQASQICLRSGFFWSSTPRKWISHMYRNRLKFGAFINLPFSISWLYSSFHDFYFNHW